MKVTHKAVYSLCTPILLKRLENKLNPQHSYRSIQFLSYCDANVHNLQNMQTHYRY